MARFSSKTDRELLDLEANYRKTLDELDGIGVPRVQVGCSGQVAVMNAPTVLVRAITEIEREKKIRGIA